MLRTEKFGLVLTEREKKALQRIAEDDGELSQSAIVRRLIRQEAMRRGVWEPSRAQEMLQADKG